MGNMLINKRVEDSIAGEPAPGTPEYRIFPDHMYKVSVEKSLQLCVILNIKIYVSSFQGPKNLGDPNFRGLSKMEEDPMIPQRMRDIARMQLCTEVVESLNKCGKDHVMYILNYSEMQCVDC